MAPRIEYQKAAPEALRAMYAVQSYVNASGIEHPLLELVKIRASQLNQCAYCLDMHTKDARAGGETEQRIHVLSAWREAPFYTPRERAALEWTEALTEIADAGVPDDLFRRARDHFSEKELVDLTMAVIAINGWNRLAISFRSDVGSYKPSRAAAGTT